MHSGQVKYRVEPVGQHWAVSFCHEPHGLFGRRVDAIRSAILDASRVERLGYSVSIEVLRPATAAGLRRRILRPLQ
ncbi:hypothetical protein [Aurantimonas sp. VKM B-3413]|uniref:hypothetical protein n=1 Tax=Aurantimonas sp. VKM B-3413 TaxID=2779401 RepID=UPI001E55B4CC|nr:hypothetical protein [Aurantimonas sp. VKM B-3413]MCB8838868.1 hypothetical protein [Aurantimonas sp. VKM B-3413]